MRINHNIAALNTYRQLTGNTASTSKSLEKLSSGLRINRAGDDAAGLAISEKMRGQIRGLDQAARNSQDGISLIQTAEGALNETHSILQRMRELAVQASNGTLTTDDREKIQGEVNQLVDEIDKIGNQTEFNTKKLLNGEIGITATSNNTWTDATGKSAVTIVGTTENTQSAVVAMAVTTAGAKSYTANAAWVGGVAAGETITVTKGTGSAAVTTTFALNSGDDQKAIVDRINATSDKSGVEAYIAQTGGVSLRSTTAGVSGNLAVSDSSAGAVLTKIGMGAAQVGVDAIVTVAGSTAFSNDGNTVNVTDGTVEGLSFKLEGIEETATLNGLAVTAGAIAGDSITLNGKAITFSATSGTNATTIAATLNGVERETGVHVSVSGTNLNFETIAKGDTAGITISYTSAAGGLNLGALGDTATYGDAAIKGAATYVAGTDNIVTTGNSNATLTTVAASVDFHVGSNSQQTMSLRVSDMRSTALGQGVTNASLLTSVNSLRGTGMTTAATSEDALLVLDQAIKNTSNERANLGAVQNRLEHTINNLSTSSENLTASESRIRDVDMAKEMMEFTKNNILSQAAQAMLAQANQQPQGVLQLLR